MCIVLLRGRLRLAVLVEVLRVELAAALAVMNPSALCSNRDSPVAAQQQHSHRLPGIL
jgi:hypothetical protein